MAKNVEFRDSCATGDFFRYGYAPYDWTANGRGSPAGMAYDYNGGVAGISGLVSEAGKLGALAVKMSSMLPYYLGFAEGSTPHIILTVNTTTGKLEVRRGGTIGYGSMYSGTLIATSVNRVFFVGDYPHIEGKILVHDTTGTIQAWVNGAPVTFDNPTITIDTRNAGAGVVDRVVWGCDGTHGWHCDFVVQRGGSDPMGDRRVIALAAASVGAFTDGTPVGAGTRLQCVDEMPLNNDTDYIEQDATGLPKSFDMGVAALPANVIGIEDIMPIDMGRKDDAGTCLVRGLFTAGATLDDGGVDVAALTTYSNIFGNGPGARHYQVDPNTGVAFTVANVATAGYIKVGRRRVA